VRFTGFRVEHLRLYLQTQVLTEPLTLTCNAHNHIGVPIAMVVSATSPRPSAALMDVMVVMVTT
jgi:hypothetical protein